MLIAHVMMSVGLLGDPAGFLSVAMRAAKTEDHAVVIELVKVLSMFSLIFGIPLSFGALLSGLTLGLGTRWGVFRYPWVTTKLILIVSVMLVGSFVIGPAENEILERNSEATWKLIAGASYDVLALAVATVLSVFKPGGPFVARRATHLPKSIRTKMKAHPAIICRQQFR
ncbi:MAG TPA: hypothetical protein VN780_02830 [Candidatus Eisenbacteria bacterium]|nr:hypothetical protein [Candidatus Eisenbacteria bacterium]